MIILRQLFRVLAMLEITDYINNDFKAIDSQDSIVAVRDFFEEIHFSHFPVTEDGVYIGCISANDLETFDFDKKINHYRYTLEPFYVRTNMIWLDVLEIFGKNQTDIMPVLDENNQYVGYYEITDIIKFFHETPFLKEAGRIIIVEKPIIDFSIGQIVQIVESNNGKIWGLFISDLTVDTVQVMIKINIGPINEIIQTFRRYAYDIISEHHEDSYIKNLQERAEYLDKYLNT